MKRKFNCDSSDSKLEKRFTDLCLVLPELSSNQLKDLKARCTTLLGSIVETHSEILAGHTYLYESLNRGLQNLGLHAFISSELLTAKTTEAVKFREASEGLWTLISSNFTKTVSQRSAYTLSVNIFFDWMHSANVPLYSNTIINNIHRIPGLIDAEFPGYIESGMWGMILDKVSKV